jgi:hypothetical protein
VVKNKITNFIVFAKIKTVLFLVFFKKTTVRKHPTWTYIFFLRTKKAQWGVSKLEKKNEKKNQVLFQKDLLFVWGCQS